MKHQMAPLPPERVTPSDPFTHVGLDAFGPFVVTRGRSTVKRWACVFTCFSTRAIHIEKLDGLDCNAFINALMSVDVLTSSYDNCYLWCCHLADTTCSLLAVDKLVMSSLV